MYAQREIGCIAVTFRELGPSLYGITLWSPLRFISGKKPVYHLYRKLDESHDQTGEVRKRENYCSHWGPKPNLILLSKRVAQLLPNSKILDKK
jgi:hypothetical protein